MTPVMEKMDAASLPPPMLDSKLASLLRICRDCPKEQVTSVTHDVSKDDNMYDLVRARRELSWKTCLRFEYTKA